VFSFSLAGKLECSHSLEKERDIIFVDIVPIWAVHRRCSDASYLLHSAFPVMWL